MKYVRGFVKLLVFSIVTACSYWFLIVSSFVIRLSGGSSARWRIRIFRAWARITAAILRMRIEVRGAPPRPPFFLVSNHLGYLDVILLGTQLDCIFVARGDISEWPIFGALCRAVNTIFIDRKIKRAIPRVIERIEQVLGWRLGVVMFPEGTSSEGSSVLKFHPSLLAVAASRQLAVSYASLTYRTPPGAGPARTDVCWWGGMGFPGHIFRLFQLPGITATIEFGEEHVRESDRKVLASKLWHAVSAQFRPVVQ